MLFDLYKAELNANDGTLGAEEWDEEATDLFYSLLAQGKRRDFLLKVCALARKRAQEQIEELFPRVFW